MSDALPPAENDAPRAGCACDPEDAALTEVVWGDDALRVTCALCGATRVLPSGEQP